MFFSVYRWSNFLGTRENDSGRLIRYTPEQNAPIFWGGNDIAVGVYAGQWSQKLCKKCKILVSGKSSLRNAMVFTLSPDLNPIEHLWGALNNNIGLFRSKNKQQMWSKIQDAFRFISPDICATLVGSMNKVVSWSYQNEKESQPNIKLVLGFEGKIQQKLFSTKCRTFLLFLPGLY